MNSTLSAAVRVVRAVKERTTVVLKNEEQQLKNATDDETGWGFDTESGG